MRFSGRVLWLLTLTGLLASIAPGQQISVPRIDQMPDRPSPYLMRNWKQVALGYDSLVYNFNLSGQYLPLIGWDNSTVNYPLQKSFGFPSYVGSKNFSPGGAEAINIIPSVVGATLAGADKSSQNGNNWVIMCQEFFNRYNGENVYLNNFVASSGSDWWYDTAPNIFFYQLCWLYPGAGNSDTQFVSVADRWLQAEKAMGGVTTPWHLPNMDHRAWKLATMTPYDQAPHEPEAAGAIAWILFNAWKKTHNLKYRSGAELAMEFLNSYPSNPAYELQLSYGAYMAARMNAELGTAYDVPKIVNWCFDVSPIRSWGAIVGRWGGLDCSGLIGEVNGSNDYPFLMNTFEQAGAFVPLVRYDDRFTKAIGKWVLNAANAARLLYPNYLPDQNQDSEEWSHVYDPNSYIGHEAMRQSGNGVSPYATGDAIRGGWANTNLGLYGSSHVGIFGGIIDTTNVPGILRLNALKTDYFHDSAYATYLYYNPDTVTHSVQINTGAGQHDLYDAASNTFLVSGVSGQASFNIAGTSAVLLVITPSGGTVTYAGRKMIINGVVVDFNSGSPPGNLPPHIKGLGAVPESIYRNQTAALYCTAVDFDGDSLAYQWHASTGVLTGSGPSVVWNAPGSTGTYNIQCVVSDGKGGTDTAAVNLTVTDSTARPPVITRIQAHPGKVDLNAASNVTCFAYDLSGLPLTYHWTCRQGSITGTDSVGHWTAPGVAGNYFVVCTVDNGHGGQSIDSTILEVRDFRLQKTGALVAYYPFNGNANDAAGSNNGIVNGASLTSDRLGNPASAFLFNGIASSIRVPNTASLNFDSSITVTFWMNVKASYAREQYPISHGNWQNRWKLSITNNRLRWTVKTAGGTTKDLDSKSVIALNTDYYVTALYNGSDMELYLNGELDTFTGLTGNINPTSVDLMIGQSLPAETGYNFNGVLDEIRIYNYGLSYQQIQDLLNSTTGVNPNNQPPIAQSTRLAQNYPNPFNPTTTIAYSVGGVRDQGSGLSGTGISVKLVVYDILGREVAVLVNERKAPGSYEVRFSAKGGSASGGDGLGLASGVYIYRLTAGSFSQVRTMVLIK